jgi:peptide/nickel transport system substrate-binding protein
VRFSLERSIRVGHEVYPGLFAAVRGASACYLAPARCSLARGVVTDDQTGTVTIRLRRPDPLLPFKLAGLPASIVPSGTSDSIRGPRPPGTGPYRISAIARDGTTRLLRNVHFRSPSSDRPDGFPDAIVLRPSPPLAQRLHHVAGGLSDVTSIDNGGRQLMPQEVSGALTRYPDRVTLAPELATDFMFLNVREPPFDDQRVRLAVNLATDRRRMVALRGGPWVAAPACSVVPPGVPHARPACPYTADPSPAGTWIAPDLRRARRLIARSGTRGEHVTVWSDTEKVRFGRYFSKLLRRLGYVTTLRILTVGFDYFHGVARARAHAQIGMFGWLADYPSPASFVDPIFSCAAWHPRSPENLNLSQLCDRALDRLVARAERTDGPAGTRAWAAAERRLDRLAPAIPLSSQRRALFVSARTGNVRESPFLGPLLEQMWVR